VTLVCRPIGRGNWRVLTVTVSDKRAGPLLVKPGHRFDLGGITYRVCEVRT
jgi:hypothetical protein